MGREANQRAYSGTRLERVRRGMGKDQKRRTYCGKNFRNDRSALVLKKSSKMKFEYLPEGWQLLTCQSNFSGMTKAKAKMRNAWEVAEFPLCQ